ncbi:hypothetical protein EDB81DRAFT_826820 [Dactylonectria macrodidyma]|uniref:Fungal-type protein kinase domain-containing protein n=1 Tax=Dactylonectria macrodidyma TaxID=307937 RepID=A0A9P9D4W3_9HYPO|nr:hypothetical protein EDB81DRAFT_826820 [Dactylonectria macrodidyma]
MMRLWEFDRLGGIAPEKFDINADGLQFVSTILAFWMNDEESQFARMSGSASPDPLTIFGGGLSGVVRMSGSQPRFRTQEFAFLSGSAGMTQCNVC